MTASCETSYNRVLFDGYVRAGDEMKLSSMTGSA